MEPLAGTPVLVTGGTSGLGYTMARALDTLPDPSIMGPPIVWPAALS